MNCKKKNSKVQKWTINLWVLKFTAVFKIPIIGLGGYLRVSEHMIKCIRIGFWKRYQKLTIYERELTKSIKNRVSRKGIGNIGWVSEVCIGYRKFKIVKVMVKSIAFFFKSLVTFWIYQLISTAIPLRLDWLADWRSVDFKSKLSSREFFQKTNKWIRF